jgi:hypothetical protein
VFVLGHSTTLIAATLAGWRVSPAPWMSSSPSAWPSSASRRCAAPTQAGGLSS